ALHLLPLSQNLLPQLSRTSLRHSKHLGTGMANWLPAPVALSRRIDHRSAWSHDLYLDDALAMRTLNRVVLFKCSILRSSGITRSTMIDQDVTHQGTLIARGPATPIGSWTAPLEYTIAPRPGPPPGHAFPAASDVEG